MILVIILSLGLSFVLLFEYSESLIMKKEILKRDNNFMEWINLNTLRNVITIFCDGEAEESIIKSMTNTVTIFPHDKISSQPLNIRRELHINNDFVIFTNSDYVEEKKFEKCVYRAVSERITTAVTKMVICDRSSGMPEKWVKAGTNLVKFLGLANILILTREECWYASPNYFIRRSLLRAEVCDEAPWIHNEQLTPDMNGQRVKVYIFDRLLSAVINRNESDPLKRYDGIETTIFYEAAKKLNFTWEFEEIKDNNKWGEMVKGSWRGGVMERLTSGDGDFSPATFWLDHSVLKYIDLSYPWARLDLLFLVPRPTLVGTTWYSLLKPLGPRVWNAVFVILVAFPIFAWCLARLHRKFRHHHLKLRPLAEYFLYQLGSVTGGSGLLGSGKESSALRWMFSWWFVFVLLLCTSYNSTIVANLSLPSYTPKIDTVKQLVKQNFSWGRTYNVGDPGKFLNTKQNYWHLQFVKNFIYYNISEERNLLLSRKFALYAQAFQGTDIILVDNPLDDDVAKIFRVMKETLITYECASAFRKNSPIKPSFDKIILRMTETGLIKAFKMKAVLKYQKRSYFEMISETELKLNYGSTVLTLEMLKYSFYLLIIGWALSLACFVLEVLLKSLLTKKNKPKVHLLYSAK